MLSHSHLFSVSCVWFFPLVFFKFIHVVECSCSFFIFNTILYEYTIYLLNLQLINTRVVSIFYYTSLLIGILLLFLFLYISFCEKWNHCIISNLYVSINRYYQILFLINSSFSCSKSSQYLILLYFLSSFLFLPLSFGFFLGGGMFWLLFSILASQKEGKYD